jgi:hypothetical protein
LKEDSKFVETPPKPMVVTENKEGTESQGKVMPRMFTVEQIKELFYINLNRSEARSKLSTAEANITQLQSEVNTLKE